MAARHNTFPGYYLLRHPKNKSLQITFLLLLGPATMDIDGDEADVYVATQSNAVDLAEVVVIPTDVLASSSIRLVTQAFAKQLPSFIPQGREQRVALS